MSIVQSCIAIKKGLIRVIKKQAQDIQADSKHHTKKVGRKDKTDNKAKAAMEVKDPGTFTHSCSHMFDVLLWHSSKSKRKK